MKSLSVLGLRDIRLGIVDVAVGVGIVNYEADE